jgi:hypothetical protein
MVNGVGDPGPNYFSAVRINLLVAVLQMGNNSVDYRCPADGE